MIWFVWQMEAAGLEENLAMAKAKMASRGIVPGKYKTHAEDPRVAKNCLWIEAVEITGRML
jgi:hypothetical protein